MSHVHRRGPAFAKTRGAVMCQATVGGSRAPGRRGGDDMRRRRGSSAAARGSPRADMAKVSNRMPYMVPTRDVWALGPGIDPLGGRRAPKGAEAGGARAARGHRPRSDLGSRWYPPRNSRIRIAAVSTSRSNGQHVGQEPARACVPEYAPERRSARGQISPARVVDRSQRTARWIARVYWRGGRWHRILETASCRAVAMSRVSTQAPRAWRLTGS